MGGALVKLGGVRAHLFTLLAQQHKPSPVIRYLVLGFHFLPRPAKCLGNRHLIFEPMGVEFYHEFLRRAIVDIPKRHDNVTGTCFEKGTLQSGNAFAAV